MMDQENNRGADMQITMTEVSRSDSPNGKAELMIQVQANELLDLPRVVAGFDDEQRGIWGRYGSTPNWFHPGYVTKDEEAETGFRFNDYWTFPKRSI